MKLPNRPKISDSEVDKIARFFFSDNLPNLLIVGVRGYFLTSMGKPGENDCNIWDDAIILYVDGELVRTFNANTDPSKARAELAMLDTGIYQFYQGRHKQRIDAFRAFPEGVRLPCRRQNFSGEWQKSFCSHINIHDGGENDTWSAGCQTIINTRNHPQFNEFRDLVYSRMKAKKLNTVTYLLLEEAQMQKILSAE